MTEADGRVIPIKVLGHWADTRVRTRGGDLFVDIPAELIQLVEADHPGHGQKFGYQLMIERVVIAELFREDLHWLDELYGRDVSRATPVGAARKGRGRRGRGGQPLCDLSAKRPYLSATEVAAELGVSVSDVEALIESKQLPPPLRGGLISRAALDAYQRRQRGEPTPVRELPPTDELDDNAIRLRLIDERLASAASDRVHEYPPEKLRQLLEDARFLSELLRRACSDDRAQDTFSGFGEREPMLVSELLADLGVSEASFGAQRDAVQRWLNDGNAPSKTLAAALRTHGLR